MLFRNRFPAFILLALLLVAGPAAQAQLNLPVQLQGKAAVLHPGDQGYNTANVNQAIKAAGLGGVSDALVVRLTQDVPVYRLWSGPTKVDAQSRNNRIGSWWSYDPPVGTVSQYRLNYAICQSWNDLTWKAVCTLRQGAVVAIGPGQSVSAQSCANPTPPESYPVSQYWQIYIDQPWTRPNDLVCPPYANDIAVNPDNITQARP